MDCQRQSGDLTIYWGRLAFPLFAFIAVEGYLHTSDLKKYIKRLIIFGIVSQVPFMLFRSLIGPEIMINIMFTLLLGIFAILVFDKMKNKYLGIIISILLIIAGQVLNVDYGWYGVGLVFLIFIAKKNKIILFISYILYILLYYFITYIKLDFEQINIFLPYIITTSLPIVFMLLYNGKLGYKMKYFYYWFYPVHMLIIYCIAKFL